MTYFQSNLPNHIPVCDADWFIRHFWHLYFKADWSEIHFLATLSLPFYALFSFQLKTCRFYLGGKKRLAVKSDENIIVEGESSIKAAEKDPSATVVTSVHLTGANVVGSVNATERFWQRRSIKFTYFAKANMASFIFTIAQLQNGSCNSTVIYSSPWKPNDLLKYHFCNNYFCICFLQLCAVLHCIQVMY